eukprot:COSAG04_NODE_55_length_30619_cov_12.038991_16_plen_98_part_00
MDLGADPFSDDPNKPQPERMAAAVASIEALGVRAVGITADCTVEAEVARAFDEAAAALGSVDIWSGTNPFFMSPKDQPKAKGCSPALLRSAAPPQHR